MINENIIQRINHMLRMAEHPNSNEHEAAAALEMAQALLLKYNLTRADVQIKDSSPAPGIGKIDHAESDGFNWKSHLAGIIAKTILCSVIRNSATNTWHLFGTYDNVRATLEMYNWVVPQLENMARNYWLKYDGHESRRMFNHGFYLGAASTIYERLKKPIEVFAAGEGRALVLYNSQALQTAIKKTFPYTVSSRTSSQSRDGMSAGRQAGNHVSFTQQRKLTGTLSLESGR